MVAERYSYYLTRYLESDSVFAIKVKSMVVFGDSYSDDGNGVFKLSDGTFPPTPYFEGRFSNGPVWIEYLSKKLDIKPENYENYATGGATVNTMSVPSASGFNDEIEVPGIRQQVNNYVTEAHDEGIGSKGVEDLFVVTSFGNDYFYSIRHGPDVVSPEQVIGQFITNLQTLYIEFGAVNFLVATLPDISTFPGFSRSSESERAFLSKLVQSHNMILKQALDVLKVDFKKIKTFVIDTDKIFKKFSKENSNIPCVNINHYGTLVCDNPDNYLFWDNLHVTTIVHEAIATEAFNILS
ncbi:SGNH/GDSL hydrolase family protein [Rhizophagus clarus]|uniref:SGNH/GDSL hydrolase family protein n=1 Tax=Rhizophagus clarus TaxID=94130 RepID=A0A8H3M3C9_9GLOM|nr:SGNH/GDSL hydrolase family protein [Rhizophagus clarus]